MNPGSQIGPATRDFRSYPLPDGGTGIDLYLKKSASTTHLLAICRSSGPYDRPAFR